MTAGISRETWERSVERYTQAPYCEYVKERGDETLFLSNYITAVRLSDESTYLVHPLYMMPYDTKKVVVELTESAVKDYANSLLFRDSNQLALINNDLIGIFNENKYKVSDPEKIKRIDALVSVGKERFYDKLKTKFQTVRSPLPLPHPEASKIKNYLPKPMF